MESKEQEIKLNPQMKVPIMGMEIPPFRCTLAIQKGTQHNLLLTTWGGIGDQICSEPTLRWATTTKTMPKTARFTLASDYPEMFAHLPFHDVYNTRKERPILDDYFVFTCAVNQTSLFDQFISHMLTNCIDYPALASFRQTLHVKDKNVILDPKVPENSDLLRLITQSERQITKYVAVHPGKHWESKTYPVDWWNAVLSSIKKQGLAPILIGAKNTPHGGGYVEVDRSGCIDLFDRTSIMESVYLLQRLPVLICSDSSPLHMAASGPAFIGYIATAKHPDYITHWRPNLSGVNEFGWRMQNFSLGGLWDVLYNLPDELEDKNVDKCPDSLLRSWLPDPNSFGPWCEGKHAEFFAFRR